MKATERIHDAKVALLQQHPFFASLALRLEYIEDDSIKTAVTNGRQLLYNPAFIEQLSYQEVIGVLAHEVLHIALLHSTRRLNRDVEKWNAAADYAINPILRANNFTLPRGHYFNKSYVNKSAEEIYALLPDGEGNNGKGQQSCGEVEDSPKPENGPSPESTLRQASVQAAIVARRQGKLPNNIELLVHNAIKPALDWRALLANFLSEIAKNDYDWLRPSTRYLHSKLYLPSLRSVEVGEIILIIDTSASIDVKMINQFGAEVQDIATTFNTRLIVIYVDVRVRNVQEIEPDEPIKLHAKGGGGTTFRAGFDYIERNDFKPRAVVYLTDGECDLYPPPPDYPVLWAQFGLAHFNPPFGEVVQVA